MNVSADHLKYYDPERYDAVPNADGTYTLVPLMWHDDASYARYQGDPLAAEPPLPGECEEDDHPPYGPEDDPYPPEADNLPF